MQKKYFSLVFAFCLCQCLFVQSPDAQVTYTITTIAGTGAAGYTGDNGSATTAELNAPSGIATDFSGNIYIGDASNNCIRHITGGKIYTVAGNGTGGYGGDGGPATAAKLNNPVGVATDPSSNNVFTADEFNGRIRMIAGPNIMTVGGNGHLAFSGDGGPATNAQMFFPNAIARDASGNIYITDCLNQRIRKINTSGTISTIAGNGTSGFAGDGGPATAAELNNPAGIALDGSGNLYIADANNNRIRKINTSGTISTFAGSLFWGYTGDGGPATAARLNNPTGVVVSSSGYVYIADKNNAVIRVVNTSNTISTYGGNGAGAYGGDGGPATAASLNNPTSLVLDASSNLYIADASNNRIREISNTGTMSTVAGNGTAGSTGDGGPATAAELNNPTGISIDGSGNLYIGDASNDRVRKVSSGTINAFAGNGTGAFAGDGGPATAAEMNNPYALTVDPTGNVFIVDEFNQRVRKVNTSGTISTFAGNGIVAFSGDGGPADSAEMFFPIAVVKDYSGNIYIADCFNQRIRKIDHNGTISTFAGTGTSGYSGDGGAATKAMLSFPLGVTVDYSGNVYIADASNNRVRKVNTSGVISTVAGNGSAGYSGDGNPATSASLNGPTGIAMDGSGNLFISDKNNSVIRRVNNSGTISTIAGNGIAGFSGDGSAATSAEMNNPWGISIDPAGDIYVSDYKNNRIRELQPNCTLTFTVSVTPPTCVGSGNGTASVDSTSISSGNSPYTYSWTNGQTTITATGLSAGSYTVTVTDNSGCNGSLKVTINPPPYIINTIAGNGSGGNTGDGGLCLNAGLVSIAAVADNSGNIYFANPTASVIKKISPNGMITNYAGTGTSGYSGDGGPATAAQLSGPSNLAFDAAGNLFITDEQNHVIRKIDGTGKISTFAGIGTSFGYTGDGGPATAAQFDYPDALAFDAAGNLYISDYDNECIRKINTSGIISTYAGTGVQGHSGDGGPATAAKISSPFGIAVDSKGNVYFSDDTSCIRMVNTAGTISTVAGIAGSRGYSGDGGPANAAKVNWPWGVSVDPSDNVIFSDLDNARVRLIDKGGIINTIGGTGTPGYSGDGGPATSAKINGFGFEGLSVDNSYNIYISEGPTFRIRKLHACPNSLSFSGIAVTKPCYGDSNGTATVSASSAALPLNYFWAKPHGANSATVTGLKPCKDTVFIKDKDFWWELDTVTIFPQPKMIISLSGTDTTCPGKGTTIGASIPNPKTYAWSNGGTSGNTTVTPTATTTYSVTATNTFGCSTDTAVQVIVTPFTPRIGISGSDTICPGSPAFIGSITTGSSYTWSTGATSQNISVTPTTTQTYSVTVDSSGCIGSNSQQIFVTPFNPMINGPDSLCLGDMVTITASGGTTYLWNDGTTSSTITIDPTTDTTYTVMIYSGTCFDTISHKVYVGSEASLCSLKFYNGFTPNGDGHNDFWIIDNIEVYTNTVEIYNRWGTLVWSASGYDNNKVVWNGNNQSGQPLPDGTYYYVVKLANNGKTYKGWVQLTR